MTRLYFCTDLHGSEVCFRKFLNAGPIYEADVVIMGGDCTGKMIVPLVHSGNGTFVSKWHGRDEVLKADVVEQYETQIRNQGLYPVRLERETMDELEADPEQVKELFTRVMLETLEQWVSLAEERLAGKGLRVIFTPGNDDEFAIDPVLRRSEIIEAPEGEVIKIDDMHEMLSLSWSNKTPWDTPRECSEEELGEKITALAAEIRDMDNAIFNIHVPPYGTGLDLAPELEDGGSKVKRGGTIYQPVGSTAVHDAIEEFQPMLSLHGHIHESRGMQRIGRTMCINPGSSYSDGILQGVLVDLDDKKAKRYVPVTG
jgi:Icc-related predicted phosphoesterase